MLNYPFSFTTWSMAPVYTQILWIGVRRLYNHIMVTLTQNVANVLSLKCTLGSFDWASWGQEELQQLISARQLMLRQQYNTTEIFYFSKQISQFFFLLTHNSYLTDFCSTLFDQINCCSDCSTWCKTWGHREKHYDTATPLNLFLQTCFHIFATISGASWIQGKINQMNTKRVTAQYSNWLW